MGRPSVPCIGENNYNLCQSPTVLDMCNPVRHSGPLPDSAESWVIAPKKYVESSMSFPTKESSIAMDVGEFAHRTTDSAFYMLNEYIPDENYFTCRVVGHMLATGKPYANDITIDDLHRLFRHFVSEMPQVQLEVVLNMFKHLYEELAPYVFMHIRKTEDMLYTDEVMPSNIPHHDITAIHEILSATLHGLTAVICIRSSLVW